MRAIIAGLLLSLVAMSAQAQGIYKFGQNPEISSGTPEDVWDCPELQTGVPEVYVFATSAMTLYVASSNAGDTTQSLTVEGLDENWAEKSVTVTLTGQTPVALSGTWMRVYRAYNRGSSGTPNDVLAGDIYISNTAAHTSGVPDDETEVKACILQGKEQTLMAIYTIPAGHVGYMSQFCATALNSNDSTQQRISRFVLVEISNSPHVATRRTKHTFSVMSHGTTTWCREYPSSGYSYSAPRQISSKTDVIIHNTGEHNLNVSASASFDIFLRGE